MPYKFNPFTGTFDDSTPGPAGVVAAANSGTALLPGITFASDPNTGIYNPGADQLAVATNGTGRLFVDSVGNVGTNVTPFAYAANARNFQVNGTGYAALTFGTTGGGTGEKYWRWIARTVSPSKTLALQTLDDSGGGEVNAYTLVRNGTAIDYHAWSAGGSERLRITSAGLVGIGTSSPGDKLHVVDAGTAAGTGSLVARFMDATNAKGVFLGYDTDELGGTIYGTNFLTFQTFDGSSWGERARITPTGNVGIGTTSPVSRLDISGGADATLSELTFAQGNSTSKVSSIIGTSSSTNEKGLRLNVFGFTAKTGIDISADAFVGINKTGPASALDVNGDVTITDKIIHASDTNTAIRFPAADTVSIETAGSERARIDSSGRLLIGTSTAPTSSSGDAVLGLGVGGIAVSKQGIGTANNGTVDIQLIDQGQRPYAGFLAVSNSLNVNRSNRTQTTFSVFGDGTTSSIQQISTASAGSAMSFTVTTPSDGVIRVTNTSGSTCDVTMVFYGCVTR
jgi:hypothetical protein